MDRVKLARLIGTLLAVIGAAYGGSEYQAAATAMCQATNVNLELEIAERKAYACTCENGVPVPRIIP